jgi:hypothetical protein
MSYGYDYVDPYALPVKLAEAWQRKEGKNPEGGLNEKGRRSLKAKGQNIKRPVSAKQAKKSPKSAARRKSFCARMGGMPGPMKDEKGRPTRKALALRKWDCRKSSAALTWDKVKRSEPLVVVAPDAEQGRMLDYPHPKEGRMVRSDLYNIALDAMQLRALLRDDDNLPQWTQSKLAVARDRVNSVREYLEAKIADHSGFEFGLPKLSESENEPTNPKLWSQMQSQAREKFKVHPSAYSNGWAAKEYKKRGGGWRKKKGSK